MSTNYSINDRYLSSGNYGKFRPVDGEEVDARIKLEKIPVTENTFKFRISRINDTWAAARCYIYDKECYLGKNFQFESGIYSSSQNPIYICGNPQTSEITFSDSLPADGMMVLAIYTREMLVDYDQAFLTTIPKANVMNQRYDLSLCGILPLQSGEAEYDMAPLLYTAFETFGAMGFPILEFPQGTYTIGSKLTFTPNLIYRGIGKVIIRPMKNAQGNYVTVPPIGENFKSGAIENITFEQCYPVTQIHESVVRDVKYQDLVINCPNITDYNVPALFMVSPSPSKFLYRNVEINIGGVQAAIQGKDNSSLVIDNCTFNGKFDNAINLENCTRSTIKNNTVQNKNGTRGILFSNSGPKLCQNILIDNNVVSGCTDIGISFDAYNYLGQGYIQEAYNDQDNFLCLVLADVRKPDNSSVEVLKVDPKECVFVFTKGTGVDGQYYYILDITTQNGKKVVRLNNMGISAAKVNTGPGAIASFSCGFIDCTIQNNTLYGNNFKPSNHNDAIAIRVSPNAFGFNFVGNHVNGGGKGIQYSGGIVGNAYFRMALNGKFINNSCYGLINTALELENGDDSLINHHNTLSGNSFVSCKNVTIKGQKNMMLSNNIFKNTNLYLDTIDETLITSNFLNGGNVTKISLGSQCVVVNNAGIV